MSFPISCAPDHSLRATLTPRTNTTSISQAAKQRSEELEQPLWDTAELEQLSPELGPFSQTNTHSLRSVSGTPPAHRPPSWWVSLLAALLPSSAPSPRQGRQMMTVVARACLGSGRVDNWTLRAAICFRPLGVLGMLEQCSCSQPGSSHSGVPTCKGFKCLWP